MKCRFAVARVVAHVDIDRLTSTVSWMICLRVVRQLVRALDIDHNERRATFVASQLFGLVLVRYVLRLRPVAAMTPHEVARWIGPTIQRYLERPA